MARMSRCRRGKDRARGGGPSGRCSIADQNRWAACERMSKLESSGSSTASNEPSGGSSLSQRRWFAPPSGTIACHPSGARRNSPPANLGRSRSYRPGKAGATAAPTDRTVDRASGAQKMACWSKGFCGSAAKRQPPLPSELRYRARSLVADQGLIVSLVLAIAAKPFPGNIRRFRFFGVWISFVGSPIST